MTEFPKLSNRIENWSIEVIQSWLLTNWAITIKRRFSGEESKLGSHNLELFLGLKWSLPDFKAVFGKQEYVSKLNVVWKILNMLWIKENMARLWGRRRVYDLEFETEVFFRIFSMRIGAVNNNSDSVKLASLGWGLTLDFCELGQVEFLVHNLFKYNLLFWARFGIQDIYRN